MNELEIIDAQTGEVLPPEGKKPLVDPDVQADFDKARDTVNAVIDGAMRVLEVAGEVAIQSQNSKAVESYAKLVDSVRGAAQDLLDVRIKFETTVAVSSEPEVAPSTVNNNLFVGSVDDFLKKLKPKQDDDDDLEL